MQPVSYSSCSLALEISVSRSYCITLAAQEELAVAQLASPLLLYVSLSVHFSPPSIVHCTLLCLTCPLTCTCMHACIHTTRTLSSVKRFALVLEIEILTKTIFHADSKGGEDRPLELWDR